MPAKSSVHTSILLLICFHSALNLLNMAANFSCLPAKSRVNLPRGGLVPSRRQALPQRPLAYKPNGAGRHRLHWWPESARAGFVVGGGDGHLVGRKRGGWGGGHEVVFSVVAVYLHSATNVHSMDSNADFGLWCHYGDVQSCVGCLKTEADYSF